MDSLEECPVLQAHSRRRRTRPSPEGRLAEFGTDREDCLGFRSEIEGLLRFVIVDPVHPVPVIEERRRSARPVHQQSVKSSVQARRKGGVLFV